MRIIIEGPDDLCQADNLLMMADFAVRYGHYTHDFATKAIKAVRDARNDYIAMAQPLFAAQREKENTND